MNNDYTHIVESSYAADEIPLIKKIKIENYHMIYIYTITINLY